MRSRGTWLWPYFSSSRAWPWAVSEFGNGVEGGLQGSMGVKSRRVKGTEVSQIGTTVVNRGQQGQ